MHSNRKKLCIVMSGHFSSQMGGAQYQVKCIIDELIKLNLFEIYYLTRYVDTNYQPVGYEIIRISEPTGLMRYSCALDTFRLYKLLLKIKPDHIYQRVLGAYTGVVAYYGRKHRCDVTYHISSDFNLVKLRERGAFSFNPLVYVEYLMGEYGLRNATNVIAQTKNQYEMFKRNYGRNASLIMQNFHPPSEEVVDKAKKPVLIMWIANFKKIKRPEIFVKLASDLREIGDVEFLMLGRPGGGDLGDVLQEEIRKTKNLQYLGEQPLNVVNQLLSKAHILVNTSLVEGFPNTFIQAWMRKVPVVSLTVNPDGVFDANSLGFCAGTYDRLKDIVIELIKNDELRSRIGDQAIDYAKTNYSVRNVEKLIPILNH